MVRKNDVDLALTTDQTKVTNINKFIGVPQQVVPTNLTTTEEQLERLNIYPDLAIGAYSSLLFQYLLYCLVSLTVCLQVTLFFMSTDR